MPEKDQKRIADKVGLWDKFITYRSPGDIMDKKTKLLKIADENEAEERRKAELEAIRQRRLNSGR